MLREMKWSKVSNQKYGEYIAFVDLFFENNSTVHFKSMVIDTHQFDHKKYSRGDKDQTFYKMFYQFLLHSFGAYLQPTDKALIHLDQRNLRISAKKRPSAYRLSTLCAILNNGIAKKYGYPNNIVRNVQAIDSKNSDYVQLADVLMGAIGYEANGKHLQAGAKAAKVDLADYIRQKAGLRSYLYNTPRSQHKFSVWQFKFRFK